MKTLLLSLLTSCLIIFSAFGQDRTDETRITVDTETGDTVLTESVIVSLTEDITPRNSMIIINPLKFLLFYNISYFHKISDQTVIGGGIQLPTISGIDGFGVNAEVRFHPSGKNLRGFYFAPNISYNNLSGDDEGDESISITSVGGLIGWQWFPGDQFAIGLGIGVDYYFFSGDDDTFSDFDGKAPLLRFDIGYAW
ncbi:MAG: hypothetical protein DRQ01_00960 [Ignavibacteriae bacterium]|nr:MAG: hypothetical protein DRQ01_00960 [Ignavibacteriota bacterium]